MSSLMQIPQLTVRLIQQQNIHYQLILIYSRCIENVLTFYLMEQKKNLKKENCYKKQPLNKAKRSQSLNIHHHPPRLFLFTSIPT